MKSIRLRTCDEKNLNGSVAVGSVVNIDSTVSSGIAVVLVVPNAAKRHGFEERREN